ncbi:hypothetical protein [Pseudofulvibacter geojedonensis]|uniref:Lipocalin-like domain-containing protein n=1 Tax=Pseudofulvibacter geojedonensis TaxID=1123758 RepID=A0ABW3I3P6_9FLAO
MIKKILFTFLLFLSINLNAQEKKVNFPNDYLGVYKGKLSITSVRGAQEIDMEFHLLKTDDEKKYHYIIGYIFDGNRQERKYTLIEKDKEKGNYVVDENNGIILNAQLFDSSLYFMFEVNGTILTTTEHFYKDSMDFIITATNKEKASRTIADGEEATEVLSYPISTLQKAHLIKQ